MHDNDNPDDDTGHRISAFQSYFARPVRPVITREAGERMAWQVALIRQADEEWREDKWCRKFEGTTQKGDE